MCVCMCVCVCVLCNRRCLVPYFVVSGIHGEDYHLATLGNYLRAYGVPRYVVLSKDGIATSRMTIGRQCQGWIGDGNSEGM